MRGKGGKKMICPTSVIILCVFGSQMRVGVDNHVCQRHGRMVGVMETCPICEHLFAGPWHAPTWVKMQRRRCVCTPARVCVYVCVCVCVRVCVADDPVV